MEPAPGHPRGSNQNLTYCTGGAEALALDLAPSPMPRHRSAPTGVVWSTSTTFGQYSYVARGLVATNWDDFS